MTVASYPHARRVLAWLWALLVLGSVLQLAGVARGDAVRFESDLLSLLPRAGADATTDAALARLSASASRRVVVVLAGSDAVAVQQAAAQVQSVLQAPDSPLLPASEATLGLQAFIDFYAPFRAGLLDPAERARIDTGTPESLGMQALARLQRPGAALRALPINADPGGSFAAWLAARARSSPLRPLGDSGLLGMQKGDQHLVVLPYTLSDTAMSVAALEKLQPLLERARETAKSLGVELLTAGVPVHAAVAAERAQWEMSTIGFGAMLTIALLMIVSFRSPRPLLLVLASVLIGVLVALCACLLVFERVHLITLVFGASLVGVAEDYGIHYVAMRALGNDARRSELWRLLLPTLGLAFGTTALGYLGLAVAPFPGLRQMALFAIVGLLAALITVILWFPYLEGRAIRATAFSRWVASTRARWPLMSMNRTSAIAAALLALFLGFGTAQLRTQDDLRALQSSPPALVEQQQRISNWLAEPSPAQFFLVSAADAESLLQREETLTARLAGLHAQGAIGAYRAISDWVPSARQQELDTARNRKLELAAGSALTEALGEPFNPSLSGSPQPLAISHWLAHPLSEPLRPLYLGALDGDLASVVMVSGLKDPKQLPALSALAAELDGVSWVDKIADYSTLLRGYRIAMSWVLFASLVLVYLLLLPRFRRDAWRVVAPTAITVLVVLAWLGYSGQPVSLFHILGALVLLGMGTDYGIFLQEEDPSGAPWLAVGLGAVSTLLAFGLLAFSHTPALSAFGSTLLLGIAVVWLLSPSLCGTAGSIHES